MIPKTKRTIMMNTIMNMTMETMEKKREFLIKIERIRKIRKTSLSRC